MTEIASDDVLPDGRRLRDYQREACDAIEQAVQDRHVTGKHRLILAMPTGTGKNLMIAETVRRLQRPGMVSLVMTHTRELVRQTAREIAAVCPDLVVEIEQADERADWSGADVIVASVPTLRRGGKRLEQIDRDRVCLAVVDECFPGGTLVDGRPIESLRPGDVVRSYDHELRCVVWRRVSRTFNRTAEALVRVRFGSGKTLICTPNHPVWTLAGYQAAERLIRGDVILRAVTKECQNDLPSQAVRGMWSGVCPSRLQDKVLFGRVSPPMAVAAAENSMLATASGSPVQGVRDDGVVDRTGSFRAAEEQSRLLQRRVQANLGAAQKLGDDVQDKSQVRGRSHETEEPHEERGSAGKGQCDAPRDEVGTSSTWRQWQRPYPVRSDVSCCHGVDVGIDCTDGKQRQEIPNPLQNRLRSTGTQAGRGSGREQSLRERAQASGCEEGCILEVDWVDGIENYESTSAGELGCLCQSYRVYNLEVEGCHNYFAEGVLVHNCHHAPALGYQRVLSHLGILGSKEEKYPKLPSPPCAMVGCTATPFRGDDVAMSNVFDDIVYQRSLREMIDAGWLCPIRAYTVLTGLSLDNVRRTAGEYNEADLDRACNTEARNETVVQAYLQHGRGRKAICFAITCEHARALHSMFQDAGIAAGLVLGDTPTLIRDESMAWFAMPGEKVIVNVGVLGEGVDIPDADCVIMARPTKSPVLFAQQIGRGTRIAPGKSDLLVLDVTDNCEMHRAVSVNDIAGLPWWFKCQGDVVFESADEVERMLLDGPKISPKNRMSMGELATRLARREIIDPAEQKQREKPRLYRGLLLAWCDTGLAHVLSIGSARLENGQPVRENIRVVENLLGQWEVRLAAGTQISTLETHATHERAMRWAEWWVRENRHDRMGLVMRKAKWREQPPSEKQVAFARTLGLNPDKYPTKALMSDAITRALENGRRPKWR